jgi:hypothetical protein
MKTTIIGGKDRSDYRAMATSTLIEEAIYNPNVELCVVLGERADDLKRKLECYRADVDSERYDYERQF